jgi:hypothetical protein
MLKYRADCLTNSHACDARCIHGETDLNGSSVQPPGHPHAPLPGSLRRRRRKATHVVCSAAVSARLLSVVGDGVGFLRGVGVGFGSRVDGA